jgi:hypothetical protein
MDGKYHCSKEAEIAQMSKDLETLKTIVMGNGQTGLYKTVIQLTSNVEAQTEVIKDLKTAISGLLDFQSKYLGQEEGKFMIRRRNRWLIGILATSQVGLIGAIIGLLIKMLS